MMDWWLIEILTQSGGGTAVKTDSIVGGCRWRGSSAARDVMMTWDQVLEATMWVVDAEFRDASRYNTHHDSWAYSFDFNELKHVYYLFYTATLYRNTSNSVLTQ